MKEHKLFQRVYLLVLAAFLISGAMLAARLAELRRGSGFYERIEEQEPPLSAAPVRPAPPAAPIVQPAVPENPEREPLKPHERSLRLAQWAEDYPDAAIWLQLPDTTLDYPVMLGTDNRFYLDHLPDGSKNALGSLFLDYRTNEDSVHLIVYGHNGSGGRMFGLLKQYESPDYLPGHRILTLATPDAAYACPVFSVRRVEADSGAYRLAFEDGGLTDYINQAAAESLYQIDVDLEDAAGVLTLSTCTGRRGQRLIVQALIPG